MNLEEIIKERKTEKLSCNIEHFSPVPESLEKHYRPLILNDLETSGWAPFHYPREIDQLAEPWRAHIIWGEKLLTTAKYMQDDLKVESKEPKLMAASNAVVIITWIPQFYELKQRNETQIIVDEEHLAAASTMTQNFLLLMQEKNIGTYWGSGGILRKEVMFDYLGIPSNERLLGAIHLQYPEMKNEHQSLSLGKNRDSRTQKWVREV